MAYALPTAIMSSTTRIFQAAGIIHRVEGQDLVVAPRQQADLAAVTPEAAARLLKRMPAGGRIRVDLSAMDSTGGGSLAVSAVMALHGAAPAATPMVVEEVPPVLATGLHALGIGGFIEVRGRSR
ncbi:MAG: hypothetical protein RLZZ127_1852 [Planctomycetota bacterium]|jgi:hypothetical protein